MVNPVESYILDQKLIENGEYVRALDSDFEKLPVEDFLRVRSKVAQFLDGFFAEDPVTPEKVRKLKGSAINSADDGQFKISALRKWLIVRIQEIEGILQRGSNHVPPEQGAARGGMQGFSGNNVARRRSSQLSPEERQKLETCRILNGEILKIFSDGFGDTNLPDVLTAFVEQHGNSMNLVNVATMLFNLGKLRMDVIEGNGEKFSALLRILARMIAISGDELNGQTIGSALYGLHRMDVSVVPKELLQALAEKISSSRQELNGQEIASGLYGLLNFDDAESLRMKNMLLHRMEERCIRNDIDVECLVQSLHLMKAKIPIWLRNLHDKLVMKSLRDVPKFPAEKVVFEYLRSERLTILCNAYVDGFELDLFLPAYQLNIEIDGIYHEDQKFRDERRDAYLRDTHGMRVLRIKLQENWRVKVDRALQFA